MASIDEECRPIEVMDSPHMQIEEGPKLGRRMQSALTEAACRNDLNIAANDDVAVGPKASNRERSRDSERPLLSFKRNPIDS
jgi:hypothetical protein